MISWKFLGCLLMVNLSLLASEMSSTTHVTQDTEDVLRQALTWYQSGEVAKTLVERREDFNHALALYTQIEEESPTGPLYYNIGNSYFQLGEYPWAILYYYRAWRLMPRDSNVIANLTLAQKKANVPLNGAHSVFRKVFFFHYYLSLPERLGAFFLSSLFLIGAVSSYIWTRHRWTKTASITLGAISLTFLLSILYSHYFSGIDAVLVRSTPLYRDAGTQYALVVDKPLPGGLKVDVSQVTTDGHWLKVITSDGSIGYVPYEAIRII